MKTIKIPELKIEVEIEIHDKGKYLKDIQIPEDWRLLRVDELIFLFNNEKYNRLLNLKNTWEFMEQPFKLNNKNNYVAKFIAYSGRASLGCDGHSDISGSLLGVRFCKNIKSKQEIKVENKIQEIKNKHLRQIEKEIKELK